jgi:hypothetical protein
MEEEILMDVTDLRPEAAAAKIARWVWWVGEFMCWDGFPLCNDGKHKY